MVLEGCLPGRVSARETERKRSLSDSCRDIVVDLGVIGPLGIVASNSVDFFSCRPFGPRTVSTDHVFVWYYFLVVHHSFHGVAKLYSQKAKALLVACEGMVGGWGVVGLTAVGLPAVVVTLGQDPFLHDYVVCCWAWWSASDSSGDNPGSCQGAVSLVISSSMWGVVSVLSQMRVWCKRFGPQGAHPHTCVVLAR